VDKVIHNSGEMLVRKNLTYTKFSDVSKLEIRTKISMLFP